MDLQVQAAFLSLAEANVLRPYMRDAVAEISKACVALQGNDASPSSAGNYTLMVVMHPQQSCIAQAVT
jgi:exocyst complex component 2